ncbi:MAG TPA: Xaa-Pro peptidase family protein [Candidatus Polarisedimenticolia bacterium]|nr:Xaa-Pro peptidase family protein [Candidatus Polarisedimenticolia bacterium]
MTRRDFLRSGAAAAAGASLAPAAFPSVQPGERPAPPEAAAPPLPPPPPRAQYEDRIARVQELLRAAKVEALLEVPGPGMLYLTGLALERSDRLVGVVVPASGPISLYCPLADQALAAEGPLPIEDVRLWEERDDPIALLSKHIRKLDVSRLAIGSRCWYDEFASIHGEMPKVTLVTTSAFVGALRERKSPEEMALVAAAASIAEQAAETALAGAREGMREADLAEAAEDRVRSAGAAAVVAAQSGPNTAVPRRPAGERRLAAGDVVVVIVSAQVRGYWAEVARTGVLGRPTGRMKLIHETLRTAQDLALERARPGAIASSVDQIARAAVGGRGFAKFYLHSLGRGLGLERIELPHLSPGYLGALGSGAPITLAPGVYTPGEYGIRIGDVMELTPDGSRLLTTPPAELTSI